MRSSEERLLLLHQRAKEYAHKRTKSILSVQGSVCSLLLLALVVKTGLFGGAGFVHTVSSLLRKNAGGCFFAALAAFTIGAVLTATIQGLRRGDHRKREVDDEK